MKINLAEYSIWIASMVLEVVILAVLIWRKHPYPAFKAYLAWQITSSIAQFYIYHHFNIWTYSMAYMVCVTAGAAFTTAVAAEVFAHVFRPYNSLPRIYLWLTLAAVALIAGWFIKLNSIHASYLENGIQFAGVTGFALTLFLSFFLSVPRRMHINGIAMGFLLYIGAQGIGKNYHLPRTLGTGAFVLIELLWLVYAITPQPVIEETREVDLVLVNRAIEKLKATQSAVKQRLGMELSFRY